MAEIPTYRENALEARGKNAEVNQLEIHDKDSYSYSTAKLTREDQSENGADGLATHNQYHGLWIVYRKYLLQANTVSCWEQFARELEDQLASCMYFVQ